MSPPVPIQTCRAAARHAIPRGNRPPFVLVGRGAGQDPGMSHHPGVRIEREKMLDRGTSLDSPLVHAAALPPRSSRSGRGETRQDRIPHKLDNDSTSLGRASGRSASQFSGHCHASAASRAKRLAGGGRVRWGLARRCRWVAATHRMWLSWWWRAQMLLASGCWAPLFYGRFRSLLPTDTAS